MRPVQLAREHGISTQAVRNYEDAGLIPQARRTAAGHRVYTETHAAALRTYLSLIPAYGYSAAGQIMTAVNHCRIDQAMEAIDHGHALLLRDRSTLRMVESALAQLNKESAGSDSSKQHRADRGSFSIGELGRRLNVSPATLRTWERAGILAPQRDRVTGHRSYDADDIRDAELAHLLRRGGYLLHDIAVVTQQIRDGGGIRALSEALQAWKDRVTARGVAMLTASANLAVYTDLIRADGNFDLDTN